MKLERELMTLLKGVSRSFYLSICFLPSEMRAPIALAYLLARLSDTLADTVSVTPTEKRQALLCFSRREFSEFKKILKSYQGDSDISPSEERLLISHTKVLKAVDHLPNDLRVAVNKVVDTIIEGQLKDVEFFEINKFPEFSQEQLEHYCYLVAGCVGEFWTEVGFIVNPEFSLYAKNELKSLGCEFGMGLQLVNILRDFHKDKQNGRRYITSDIEDENILSSELVERAKIAMEKGINYADSLSDKSSKMAVYLPASLGNKTLNKLQNSTLEEWKKGVKIPRVAVYKELILGVLR